MNSERSLLHPHRIFILFFTVFYFDPPNLFHLSTLLFQQRKSISIEDGYSQLSIIDRLTSVVSLRDRYDTMDPPKEVVSRSLVESPHNLKPVRYPKGFSG